MPSRLATVLTTGALAAGLGAGALGVASAADSPSPSPSASTAPDAGKAAKGDGSKAKKPLLRRALHAEVVVRQKDGFRPVALQRGEITAVSATSITVKSRDGYTRGYTVDAETKVRAKGEAKAISDLKTGERAMIWAVKAGDAYLAKRIVSARDAQPATPSSSPSPSA